MEIYYTKLLETAVVITIFIAIRIIVNQLIRKTIIDKVIQKSRSQLISRALNLILFLVSLIFIMVIWGVKQSELVVFIGSILTIVGVAFFAQWSLFIQYYFEYYYIFWSFCKNWRCYLYHGI